MKKQNTIIFAAVAVLGLAAAVVIAQPSEILKLYGGFESNTLEGWEVRNNFPAAVKVEVSSLKPNSGKKCLRVDGKDAVSCTTPPLTMVIDYKTQQSCADDVISIQTDPVLPTACWDSSEAAGDDVKDAAAGFLADLELAGSIHAVMSSIQPAYDESFIGGGREGGYLNIVNMAIDGL